VEDLALLKARKGADAVAEPSIIIGSDTTVVLDGEILNKPDDEEHAVKMLRLLSGRTHTVFTGLALVHQGGRHRVASRRTDVTFRPLDDGEIVAYVRGGSPMDKAGAYGIQDDFGAVFVSRVEGCYYTIVGLPLELLYVELRAFASELRSQ
jgi:septum formation protein